jgi:phage terminase small subunit
MAVDVKELLGLDEDSGSALERIARQYRLTDLQKNYVKHYVANNGNRTKAMLAAGYQSEHKELIEDRTNKSDAAKKARTTLSVTGTNLMQNRKILKAIEEYKDCYVAERRSDIEQDVYRVAQIRAFYDIRDMVDTVVGYSPDEVAEKIRRLPEEAALCIDNIKFNYHGKDADRFTVDIKFADRQKNIEFLSKLTGLMVEKKEVHNTGTRLPQINIGIMQKDGTTEKFSVEEN